VLNSRNKLTIQLKLTEPGLPKEINTPENNTYSIKPVVIPNSKRFSYTKQVIKIYCHKTATNLGQFTVAAESISKRLQNKIKISAKRLTKDLNQSNNQLINKLKNQVEPK